MSNRSFGIILLCAWLILYGFLAVSNLQFALSVPLLGFLAIGAGVLLLMGR